MLQGKCTENHLLLFFDVASFLPVFHYDGGKLGMTLYVDLGQKCNNKLHKTIDALEAAR